MYDFVRSINQIPNLAVLTYLVDDISASSTHLPPRRDEATAKRFP